MANDGFAGSRSADIKPAMQGFEGLLISLVIGAGLGFGLAFLIRRWRGARQAKAKANAPKTYISRQVSRREERERAKAERKRGG